MTTIGFLNSNSKDSIEKAQSLAAGFIQAGCNISTENADYLIPTSDARANELYGTYALSDKSVAYSVARRFGLPTLRWNIPETIRLLEQLPFGRIFVKPSMGSGKKSPHRWGYKPFNSPQEMSEWLRKEDLAQMFEDMQQRPHAWLGKYIVSELAETSDIYGIHLMKDVVDEVHVFGKCFMPVQPEKNYRVVYCDCNIDTPLLTVLQEQLKPLMQELPAGVLYVQAVEHQGQLIPIDFNQRLGTLFSQLTTLAYPQWYTEFAQAFLGRQALSEKLPAEFARITRTFYEDGFSLTAAFRR